MGGCAGTLPGSSTQPGGRGWKSGSVHIPLSPCAAQSSDLKGVSFAMSWCALGKRRMGVVSWTLITWLPLWPVFDSVRSLAQTYDLCSVRQHYPSPRWPLAGVEGFGGPHRVSVVPDSLS